MKDGGDKYTDTWELEVVMARHVVLGGDGSVVLLIERDRKSVV